MIIKSSRVPTNRTKQIANYFGTQGDNDTVKWIRGGALDIEMMGVSSRIAGAVFSVHHVIIAPEIETCHGELRLVLDEFAREYQLSTDARAQICIAEHQKCRVGEGAADRHWHVALPEVDPFTCRVLDNKFTKLRDEKVARIAELRLGHPVVAGRFNRAVFKTLQSERPELDLTPYKKALQYLAEETDLGADRWLDARPPRRTRQITLPDLSKGFEDQLTAGAI
ncbi:hypothetical protein [Shimia biformata]|uniref:hypothetical protein n=1 Tax=Shimia biformata TaxID=1294299 RepID=UPI00194F8C5B|nr:hypothetical protein [Shimia biformata]